MAGIGWTFLGTFNAPALRIRVVLPMLRRAVAQREDPVAVIGLKCIDAVMPVHPVAVGGVGLGRPKLWQLLTLLGQRQRQK